MTILLLLTGVTSAFAAPASGMPDAKPAAQLPVLKLDTPSAFAETANIELTQGRWAVHKDAADGTSKLRLVLDVTGPVKVDSSLAGLSPRLVVVINDAAQGNLRDMMLDGQIATKASFVKTDNDTRLVIDLPGAIDDSDYRVFTLPKDEKNNKPFRVVVDINNPLPPVSFNFTPGLKGKVIALDPGHGGSDPGAIGPAKTSEKNLTLAIAQNIRTLLEKAGAKVIMTRRDDRDVSVPNSSAAQELGARTAIANTAKADIFLSVHINSFVDKSAGGSATYYYRKSVYDYMLARNIQTGLIQADGLQDRGAIPANFYVVKRTAMPAALVEVAFISNPNEEKLLNTPQFQLKAAQGIVQGLEQFFQQASQQGGGQ